RCCVSCRAPRASARAGVSAPTASGGRGRVVTANQASLPELDAVLMGLVIIEDPNAAAVEINWFESPRWQRGARVLLRHRAAGRPLGGMIRAGEVLEAAGVDMPWTTAAEAVCATVEAAPTSAILRQAQERLPRLPLRRLANLLLVTAPRESAAIRRGCPGGAGPPHSGGRRGGGGGPDTRGDRARGGVVMLDAELRDAQMGLVLASVLDDIERLLTRYVVFRSSAQVCAVALWVVHAHTLRAVDVTPYLHVRSAEMGAGKTRLLEVLHELVPRPWHAVQPTEAVLVRRFHRDTPTLLLRETDAGFVKHGRTSW